MNKRENQKERKREMKKRKILSAAIAVAMMVMTPLAAFAETAASPINVSLSDAKAMMMEGVQGETLEIGKLGDQAAAASATEGLAGIKDALNGISQMYQAATALSLAGNYVSAAAITETADTLRYQVSYSSKVDAEKLKRYAKSIVEPNDKARHNALDLQSIEMYYNVKAAEEGLATVRESYDLAQTIYNQTQKKYKLGTVSKVDLLNAELDLAEAKDKLTSTENGVKSARMGFNILFGYDLMQEVNLTDSIAVPTLPAISVEDAVKSALENRNEIREADYMLGNIESDFAAVSAYPRSSATYIKGKIQYLGAKASCDMVPITVEQDIRTQYDNMHQLYDALQTSAKNVANAKETLRLTQLQYNSALVTYNTVQQVRMLYESALLGEASAKLNYALAVEKFNMSIDVGVNTAGF